MNPLTSSRRRRTVLSSLLLSAALVAPAQVLAGSPAGAAETCDITPGASLPFYPGPSVSATYDALFSQAGAIPHLSTHVPQGMTTWPNWDGAGHHLILLAMYRDNADSYLVAIDPINGSHYGTIAVAEGHMGGIAVTGTWLFTQDDDASGDEKVRKYKLETLRTAFQKAHAQGTKPYVSRSGSNQTLYGADFMTAYDGRIWSGRYKSSSDKMYEYKVSSSGSLSKTGSSWKVPAQTQGLLVTADRFVFNTSTGDTKSRIYVTPKSHSPSFSSARCFAVPARSQNLALVGGTLFLAFEGGAYKYPNSKNRVMHLHSAPLSGVLGL